MPNPIDPVRAADLSMNNRAALGVFTHCGCYFCLRSYASSEVTQFTDILDNGYASDTAICPHCSVDAVLPGVTDPGTLRQCHEYWFANPNDTTSKE